MCAQGPVRLWPWILTSLWGKASLWLWVPLLWRPLKHWPQVLKRCGYTQTTGFGAEALPGTFGGFKISPAAPIPSSPPSPSFIAPQAHLPPNVYFKLGLFSKFLNKASIRILRDTPFVRNWTFHLCHLNEIPGSMSHFWRTVPGIYLKGTSNNSPRGFY